MVDPGCFHEKKEASYYPLVVGLWDKIQSMLLLLGVGKPKVTLSFRELYSSCRLDMNCLE